MVWLFTFYEISPKMLRYYVFLCNYTGKYLISYRFSDLYRQFWSELCFPSVTCWLMDVGVKFSKNPKESNVIVLNLMT